MFGLLWFVVAGVVVWGFRCVYLSALSWSWLLVGEFGLVGWGVFGLDFLYRFWMEWFVVCNLVVFDCGLVDYDLFRIVALCSVCCHVAGFVLV